MSEAKRCPQCQAEIPAGAPEGLCPQCLLGAALKPPTQNADVGTAGFSPSAMKFVPPTPEALQAALPSLEVLQLLGQGGMGAVYKARQPGLDRFVAVKILPPAIRKDPAFAERFSREARALARLNHPNIVGVYDFGQTDDYCYFVMEHVDGINLRQAIRAGELKSAEVLKIVPQICDALQFAHDEGIVHRDIKPENILLDKKGRVKIADFGLAKLLGAAPQDVSLTGTQQVMGTLHYMAPEQLEGSRGVDHRADIYSLGVTFYEMLTGELPIGRFAAPSKKVQIDVRLDEVVLRSLEKEPELRYQHASEIKSEMEGIVRTPPPAAASATTGPSEIDLEQVVLNNQSSKWLAVRLYREKTGANLKDAAAAVEAIAQKHGIRFPPVPVRIQILGTLAMTAFMYVVGLWVWVFNGLSPILAVPVVVLIAAPIVRSAWRHWGTAQGRNSAIFATAILLPTLGIPLATILTDPEPTLKQLYAATGVAPGPRDAPFLQLLFWGGLVGGLAWLVRTFLKSRAERGASMEKKSGQTRQAHTFGTHPASPAADAMRMPSYFRTVAFPALSICVVLLVALFLCVPIFQPQDGADHPHDPDAPMRLMFVGASAAAFAFVVLNCVWLYRSTLPGGKLRRTVHVVGWTIACSFIYAILWGPAELESGYVDRELWPYRGAIESTVSLKPRFAVSDPADYRRLVITEVRALQATGRKRREARYTRHDFTVQIDLADGKSWQIRVDALDNSSFRYVREDGTEVRGPLLDLPVALAWMNNFELAKGDGKASFAISVDRQTQFWLDLLQARSRGEAGITPVRLDTQARALLESYRPQTAGEPFFEPAGSEKSSFEQILPIQYVGVPLTFVIWAIGLWLLLRHRTARKIETQTSSPSPTMLGDPSGPTFRLE